MHSSHKMAGTAGLLVMALALGACGGQSDSASTAAAGANTSSSTTATAKDQLPQVIKLGATSEKTGPVPILGNEAKGYKAAAKYINAHGGIAGHQIQVTISDNAGNPGKAVSDVRN